MNEWSVLFFMVLGVVVAITWLTVFIFMRNTKSELAQLRKTVQEAEKERAANHETLKNAEQRLASLGAELGYDWRQQMTWAHWKKRDK